MVGSPRATGPRRRVLNPDSERADSETGDERSEEPLFAAKLLTAEQAKVLAIGLVSPGQSVVSRVCR